MAYLGKVRVIVVTFEGGKSGWIWQTDRWNPARSTCSKTLKTWGVYHGM